MIENDVKKGDCATVVGLFHKHPATVVFVDERRMLVQEDRLHPTIYGVATDSQYLIAEWRSSPSQNKFIYVTRDLQGVIRGFTRRKNSKKWHSADPGKNLSIIVGKRQYEQRDPGAALP